MMKPIAAALMAWLAAWFTGAAAPAEAAPIARSVEDVEQAEDVESGYSYSSAFSSYGSADGEAESTLLMDDGFGRMAEFHMVRHGKVMTLSIRDGGALVWQGSRTAETGEFSVTRHDAMGRISFRIHLGGHDLTAEVVRGGAWSVTE